MEEKRKAGRPPAKHKNTTVLIGVSMEDAELIKKAHQAFIDTNGIAISKSQFLRSIILRGIA